MRFMQREALVVLALMLPACGARSPLDEFIGDSGAKLDGDASAEMDGGDADSGPEAEPDVENEAGPLPCPVTPPTAGSGCSMDTTVLQCGYLSNPPTDAGIVTWCCMLGDWEECTIVADTGFDSCSQILCTEPEEPGVECIVGDGEKCCTCSSDMTVDRCGPC
jgi:hypothetical protein